MKKFFKVFVLAALGCTMLASTAMANQLEGSNTITVRGHAERQVTPDTAFVIIGVVTQHEKVEVARQENAAKIERIVRSMNTLGIANKDISTSSFDLRPVYTTGNDRKITAYALENVLTVKVKDIKNIGSVVDNAFAQGANRLDGIRFASANADDIQKELLQEAVRDGLSKARLVANAGGRNVGSLIKADIGSNGSVYPEARMMKAMNDASGFAGSQVFVGNLVITADVTLVYQMQ